MKLENQLTSLELSKKLKELGVKQESLFYWQGYLHSNKKIELVNQENLDINYDYCSAFTVAELGEMLPINSIREVKTPNNKWLISWCGEISEDGLTSKWERFTEDTEANARAKMLIYLLENNYL